MNAARVQVEAALAAAQARRQRALDELALAETALAVAEAAKARLRPAEPRALDISKTEAWLRESAPNPSACGIEPRPIAGG